MIKYCRSLPAPVIARARTVLALLEGEAEHLVPALAPAVAGAKRPRGQGPVPDQLGLFIPVAHQAAMERLRTVDVNALTPLAALQFVAELSAQAKS